MTGAAIAVASKLACGSPEVAENAACCVGIVGAATAVASNVARGVAGRGSECDVLSSNRCRCEVVVGIVGYFQSRGSRRRYRVIDFDSIGGVVWDPEVRLRHVRAVYQKYPRLIPYCETDAALTFSNSSVRSPPPIPMRTMAPE